MTEDFEKPEYQWAMDQLLENSPEVKEMDVMLVEVQAVQGKNFRFTVIDKKGNIFHYIVFVPLNVDLSAYLDQVNSTLLQLFLMQTHATDVFLRSNWTEVN